MRAKMQWRWLMDEVLVTAKGARRYLWQAVDHDGEGLEGAVSKAWDRGVVLTLLTRSVTCHGRPEAIVTDRLRSYRALAEQPG